MEIPLAFRLFISSDSPGVLCNLGILHFLVGLSNVEHFFLTGRYGVLPQMFIKGMAQRPATAKNCRDRNGKPRTLETKQIHP